MRHLNFQTVYTPDGILLIHGQSPSNKLCSHPAFDRHKTPPRRPFIMRIKTFIISIIVLCCTTITTQCFAQEDQIVNKDEVDLFYKMDRQDWESYVKQVSAPDGHQIRFKKMPTGTSYVVSYPSGMHLSVQPLYNNKDTLEALLIGSYYPKDIGFSFDEEFRQDIEKQTQQELGSHYTVKADILDMGSDHRGVEFWVTPTR